MEGANRIGWGEVAPIAGLSQESPEEVERWLQDHLAALADTHTPGGRDEIAHWLDEHIPLALCSIRMGLEMAWLDWFGKGVRKWFETNETHWPVSINGLVWMNEPEGMLAQAKEKIAAGFDTIKLKIGAGNFDNELELIRQIRAMGDHLTIRLDANGGFKTNEVLHKLKLLAAFDVHSIEQPIMPRQPLAMEMVVAKSPIPVALDEELIGVYGLNQDELLDAIQPQYLVLKPSLLGGFQAVMDWIQKAEQRNIQWWVTSYLESNLGLLAIAQFVAQLNPQLAQGLGTGGLYTNNFDGPLCIKDGQLFVDSGKPLILPFN